MKPIFALLALFALTAGCSDPPEHGEDNGGGNADGDTDSDADGDADGDADSDADADLDTDADNDGDADGDADSDADADGDADSDTDTVDCDALPPLPITDFKKIEVPGFEDFTFDAAGHMVGVTIGSGNGDDGNHLVQVSYSGQSETIVPNVGTLGSNGTISVRGVRFLPKSDYLVFADIGSLSLMRLDMSDFTKEPLSSGFNEPNGVAVDMDGFAYLTGGAQKVVRIDPMTGDAKTLYEGDSTTDGIGFSPDYSTLYFDSEFGQVFAMPINDDGSVEEAVELVNISEEGEMGALDGLTVDICGNVYVVQMTGIVWRVSPGGDLEKVVELPMGLYNAVNFGSGLGDWKADAVYVVSMGGDAYEVEVGVIGAPQPHLP